MSHQFHPSSFHESDGDRSHQASITTDLIANPIPSRTSSIGSEAIYPPVPTQAPSAMIRGDLAMIDVEQQLTVTSSGPSSSGCFASFGNREKPRKGQEDAFCRKYRAFGFIKNTETDPASAFFMANGGVPRINSTQVAIQVAGAITSRYTHPTKTAIMGDALIWYPPDPKRVNSNYKRDERPTPMLGPLHWSLLQDTLRNVYAAMLSLHQGTGLPLPSPHDSYRNIDDDAWGGSSPGDLWGNVASEKKRSILLHIMAGLAVLTKRGYVSILTPKISKERALKDRFIEECNVIKSSSDSPDVKWGKVEDLLEEYTEAMRTNTMKGGYSRSSKGHQEYYRYSPESGVLPVNPHDPMRNIEVIARDQQDYLETYFSIGGNTTLASAMYRDEVQHESIIWMIENLGLAGGPNGCGNGLGREPIHNVIYDILETIGSGSGSNSVGGVVGDMPHLESRDSLIGIGETNPSMDAFKSHLRNHVAGEEISYMELRDMIEDRVVGYALSSAAGGTNDPVGGGGGRTIDLVIGKRRM